MQFLKAQPVGPATFVVSAALLIGAAPALADIVPVSRTTALSAFWVQSQAPGPSSSGNASDGTTNLDAYSNSITSGSGSASQTSYLTANGAYALVSAGGSRNTSVMQPYHSQGNSSFTYVFSLTESATLTIIGSLDRGSPFVPYGVIEIYNAANTRVYQAVGTSGFVTSTPIFDTYFAAAGQYRFVVSAINGGAGGGAPSGPSSAHALLSIPAPAAATPLTLAAVVARRRRR